MIDKDKLAEALQFVFIREAVEQIIGKNIITRDDVKCDNLTISQLEKLGIITPPLSGPFYNVNITKEDFQEALSLLKSQSKEKDEVTGLWYCETCGYFDLSEPTTTKRSARFLGEYWDCPVCKHPLLNISRGNPFQKFNEHWLKKWIKDLNENFPSGRLDNHRPQYAPLNWLVETFHWASYFIHITTATPPDDFFLGMLALKQAMYQHCYIRILTWKSEKRISRTLDRLNRSGFLPGIFTTGMVVETIPQLHQKLIIVDGFVAFKGSANATLASWTREGELIEFTTEPLEVKALNDEYFVKFLMRARKEAER